MYPSTSRKNYVSPATAMSNLNYFHQTSRYSPKQNTISQAQLRKSQEMLIHPSTQPMRFTSQKPCQLDIPKSSQSFKIENLQKSESFAKQTTNTWARTSDIKNQNMHISLAPKSEQKQNQFDLAITTNENLKTDLSKKFKVFSEEEKTKMRNEIDQFLRPRVFEYPSAWQQQNEEIRFQLDKQDDLRTPIHQDKHETSIQKSELKSASSAEEFFNTKFDDFINPQVRDIILSLRKKQGQMEQQIVTVPFQEEKSKKIQNEQKMPNDEQWQNLQPFKVQNNPQNYVVPDQHFQMVPPEYLYQPKKVEEKLEEPQTSFIDLSLSKTQIVQEQKTEENDITSERDPKIAIVDIDEEIRKIQQKNLEQFQYYNKMEVKQTDKKENQNILVQEIFQENVAILSVEDESSPYSNNQNQQNGCELQKQKEFLNYSEKSVEKLQQNVNLLASQNYEVSQQLEGQQTYKGFQQDNLGGCDVVYQISEQIQAISQQHQSKQNLQEIILQAVQQVIKDSGLMQKKPMKDASTQISINEFSPRSEIFQIRRDQHKQMKIQQSQRKFSDKIKAFGEVEYNEDSFLLAINVVFILFICKKEKLSQRKSEISVIDPLFLEDSSNDFHYGQQNVLKQQTNSSRNNKVSSRSKSNNSPMQPRCKRPFREKENSENDESSNQQIMQQSKSIVFKPTRKVRSTNQQIERKGSFDQQNFEGLEDYEQSGKSKGFQFYSQYICSDQQPEDVV